MSENNSLRQTFDQVAVRYHEARPRYPDDLFSALIDVTGLHRNSKLLEIGPGTGQATRSLAEKGFEITAIELGAALAEVARHELRDHKNVRVITGAFEEAILPEASFDLVFAATSFHWIDPSIKFSKTHQVLKPDGHLAIIHTHHTSDEQGDVFFKASQPLYERYNLAKREESEPPKAKDLKPDALDARLFRLVHFQVFPVVITYSAKNFVKLLGTYSNHLAAGVDVQQSLFNDIERLINDKFQGNIEKHFSMALTVAVVDERHEGIGHVKF
jgi:ubiquinone/menaquinone biosynthesis C-methylase UbiE